MGGRRLAAALTIAAVFGFGVSNAVADARDEAQSAFRIAAKAYSDRQYAVAAVQFDLAYEKFAAPEIAFSAAQAHRFAFQENEAFEHLSKAVEKYRLYIEKAPQGPRVGDARDHLARLEPRLREAAQQQKVEEINARAQRSRLLVSVEAPEATVTIDGKAALVNQYQDVEPGPHQIVVSAPGYEPMTVRRDVARGDQVPVQAMLVAKPARLTLPGAAEARVAIDGRQVTPIGDTVDVPHGRRFLTVSRRGRTPFARELELAPGQSMVVDSATERTGQRKAALVAVAGAALLGALAVGTGTMTWIQNSEATDLRDAEPLRTQDQSAYRSATDSRDRWRAVTIGFATSAVVLGAAGAALYFLDSPEAQGAPVMAPTPSSPGFTPMSLESGMGVSYEGSF